MSTHAPTHSDHHDKIDKLCKDLPVFEEGSEYRHQTTELLLLLPQLRLSRFPYERWDEGIRASEPFPHSMGTPTATPTITSRCRYLNTRIDN